MNLSNFKITISFENHEPYKLSFNGSLPKFYHGNNLIHLDWSTTKDAIQELSDNLNVDISKAVLTRVDFGVNIPLNHHVYEYTESLLAFPRLVTMRFRDSVTFFNKIDSRNFIFYDKVKELNKRRGRTENNLPYNLKENILRYEIQLKKNLKIRFGIKKVRVKDLFRDTVQNKLVDYWFKGYEKVEKMALGTDPDYMLKEYNGLQKYMSYHGLERLGYDRVIGKISEQNFEVKNSRVKRSKMRGSIKKLLKEVEENGLDKGILDELNNKIIYIKDYILLNKSVPYFNSEKDLEKYY
ncbi:phage/plasmid replication domain-containing protein [Snuella lapsa]